MKLKIKLQGGFHEKCCRVKLHCGLHAKQAAVWLSLKGLHDGFHGNESIVASK